MKNFYLTDTVYLSGWQYKASQLMDTLSLLQNRVKPIKIKQELLFFQADQYILGVLGLGSIASFFFIQIQTEKTMFTWSCMKQLLKLLCVQICNCSF